MWKVHAKTKESPFINHLEVVLSFAEFNIFVSDKLPNLLRERESEKSILSFENNSLSNFS